MSATLPAPPSSVTESERTLPNPARSTAGLKRRSVRGAAVTGVSQFLRFGIRLGSTAVLARLLVPEEFGLIAMTTVVTGFIGLFTDAGLASATIQRETITQRQVSNLFWLNVAAGIALAALVVLIAPGVAWFYDDPRLAPVCAVLSVSFVFGGLTVQHQAILRREMRFKALAGLELVTVILAVAVAIGLGLAGVGYWALVGMSIATAVVPAVGVWLLLPWRPSRPEGFHSTLPLLRFGGDVLAFNVVNYFARQADNLLVGWYWGPAALGLYDKAYSLLLLPIRQINGPLASVAMPVLARTQADPARFARFFLGAVQAIASICLPLVVIVALFADEVVRFWLGPGWEQSADLFRLLAAAAAIGAINNPVGWLLVALGLTRRYRQLGFRNSAVIVLSFAIGLPFGAAGVALAYSIATAGLFLPTWWYALRGTPVALSRLLLTLVPPVCSTVAAAAAAFAVAPFAADRSAPVRAGVAAAIFAGAYAVVLLAGFRRWSFFRGILAQLRS